MWWFGGFYIIRVSVDKMVGMLVVAVVGYCTVLIMVVVVTGFVRVAIVKCSLCDGGGGIDGVEVMVMMIVWY